MSLGHLRPDAYPPLRIGPRANEHCVRDTPQSRLTGACSRIWLWPRRCGPAKCPPQFDPVGSNHFKSFKLRSKAGDRPARFLGKFCSGEAGLAGAISLPEFSDRTSLIGPAQQHAARGVSGAHRHQQHQVTLFQLLLIHRVAQSERNGAASGVSIAVYIDHHPLVGQA